MTTIWRKTRIPITFALAIAISLIIVAGQTQPLADKDISQCQADSNNTKSIASSNPKSNIPLSPVSFTPDATCFPLSFGTDEQLWGRDGFQADKAALLKSIDYSLRYLVSKSAATTYRRYEVVGISQQRVVKSLKRFRELLLKSRSPEELKVALQREFVFYQSVGKDGKGSVLFTAYFEPVYAASRTRTAEYRYPIYRRPPDLGSWSRPHPTREQLEGKDGLQGSQGRLRGLELFWFRDRLEPYQLQIQGSGRLQLTDGQQTTVGYAGNTAYSYTSIGRELIKDGKLPQQGVTMPTILEYFQAYPLELNEYIPRDRSFVFFEDNKGSPATGSISVPLTAERSIATDKSLMPPGALALIHASIPYENANREMEYRVVSRYVLDQDTGGAITGAGRVDYFLGTGDKAGDRAGLTVGQGQLYYLLLK